MQLLGDRISQSVNELGLQIDLLYKLTQNNRQIYLNKVQHIKTQLLLLKSNLRQNNKSSIEVKFKNIRNQIIQFKRSLQSLIDQEAQKKINQQNLKNQQNVNSQFQQNLKQNKLNLNHKCGAISRNTSNVGIMKHINKKEYQDLMVNIVDKTQTNKQLTMQNQDLIKLNQQLTQKNKQIFQQSNEKQHKLKCLNAQLKQLNLALVQQRNRYKAASQDLIIQRSNSAQKQYLLSHYIAQIQSLKQQLSLSVQKQQNCTQLSQLSIYKCSIIQQNYQKLQIHSKLLQQQSNYKQTNYLKRINQLEGMLIDYKQIMKQNQVLKQKINIKNQDLHILEVQLNKMQQNIFHNKLQTQNVNNIIQHQHKLYKTKQQQFLLQINQQRQLFTELKHQKNNILDQNIYLKQKILQCESILQLQRQQNKKLQQIYIRKQKSLIQKERTLMQQKQLFVCDIEIKRQQIQRLQKQTKRALQLIKTLQQEIQQHQKSNDYLNDQRKTLSLKMEQIFVDNRQIDIKYQQIMAKYLKIQQNYMLSQQQVQQLMKKNRSIQNQLRQTRVRLHKAKIQTIHDLRNSLF